MQDSGLVSNSSYVGYVTSVIGYDMEVTHLESDVACERLYE